MWFIQSAVLLLLVVSTATIIGKKEKRFFFLSCYYTAGSFYLELSRDRKRFDIFFIRTMKFKEASKCPLLSVFLINLYISSSKTDKIDDF